VAPWHPNLYYAAAKKERRGDGGEEKRDGKVVIPGIQYGNRRTFRKVLRTAGDDLRCGA
jgi:hypothetical protein